MIASIKINTYNYRNQKHTQPKLRSSITFKHIKFDSNYSFAVRMHLYIYIYDRNYEILFSCLKVKHRTILINLQRIDLPFQRSDVVNPARSYSVRPKTLNLYIHVASTTLAVILATLKM